MNVDGYTKYRCIITEKFNIIKFLAYVINLASFIMICGNLIYKANHGWWLIIIIWILSIGISLLKGNKVTFIFPGFYITRR